MSDIIKKFCKNKNFKILDELSYKDKLFLKQLLLNIKKRDIPEKNKVFYKLLKYYFHRQKESLDDKWNIIGTVGKPGKDGTAYLLTKNGKKYIMKQFKTNKSYDRVRREVKYQILASMVGVAPKIHEFGKLPSPYIVMDYVDGYTLPLLIRSQKGKLTNKQQQQIVDAYNKLDEIKVYHNDPNPLNLIFNKQGDFFLIDYGFSKDLTKNKSNLSSLRTLLYGFNSAYARKLKPEPKVLIDTYNNFRKS